MNTNDIKLLNGSVNVTIHKNYLKDDDKVLDPELIVNLGDINEIRITSPYKNHITE